MLETLNTETTRQVQNYYGEVLTSSRDLQTNACCTIDDVSDDVRAALLEVHPEVIDRFYGCGSPIPSLLTGLSVLDLGCGSGRDSYVLSKLVGDTGSVIGVDMTAQQLAVADTHREYHREAFGHSKSNATFLHGHIEDLTSLAIADNSMDLVVSNCVINLSAKKELVFKEIFRVLKPGGELYFSDVFSDRRIPQELKHDPVLLGECLSGALYTEDFRRMLLGVGCPDYRICNSREITIANKAIEEKIGMINFSSLTVRAFKLALEDRCEDFGQIAIYKGGIPGHRHSFALDSDHTFFTNKPELVCGNTALMLSGSRFGEHFQIIGDTSQHYGLFDCSPKQGGKGLMSEGACC
jgi:arsenite methyltransferase